MDGCKGRYVDDDGIGEQQRQGLLFSEYGVFFFSFFFSFFFFLISTHLIRIFFLQGLQKEMNDYIILYIVE